jgi:hypothetical protein
MIDPDICPNCSKPTEHSSIKELILWFPFPTTLRFEPTDDFVCESSNFGKMIVQQLPENIDSIDHLGNRLIKNNSETYKHSICKRLDDPGF